MKKLLFQILTGTVGSLIGRNNLVRYGNFLSRAGRLDYPDGLSKNGESMVQNLIIKKSNLNKIIVIDCGANKGKWTDQLCKLFLSNKNKNKLNVYCFEPSSYTFKKLLSTIEIIKSENIKIKPVNKALSNTNEKKFLSIVHPGAGSNSLFESPEFNTTDKEIVKLIKLSSFLEVEKLSKISLLKIDAEGGDPNVIKGAKDLIKNQNISVIQFEYNWKWIYSGYFLYDIFKFFKKNKYTIGKITPKGVQFYPKYDIDLETFIGGNYIACTDEWYKKFPKVEYWKSKSY